jgi:imidazoleglycerol-phosphate dehydratase
MRLFPNTDNANMDYRTAEVERNTLETQIKIKINLDGSGKASFQQRAFS